MRNEIPGAVPDARGIGMFWLGRISAVVDPPIVFFDASGVQLYYEAGPIETIAVTPSKKHVQQFYTSSPLPN